jgi:hypothetical protein
VEILLKHREWQILAAYYIIACAGDGYAVGLAINGIIGVAVGCTMALFLAFVMSSMSTRRKIAFLVLPLVIALGTAFVISDLVHTYHNAADRWAAIGAVATLATLVVALLTLPLALIQLGQVQQDLSQLTQVTEVERQLTAQRLLGLRLYTMPDLDEWVRDYRSWVDDAAALIQELTDDAEAETFRNLPAPSGIPTDQLQAQLDYLRTDLIPRVRAGYWSTTA